ncbi:TonB-dependent receptor domain-containing protein [Thauera sinica]|uniref:TonB-dependent receptor domain-containing protein n=1 Tax=Thauera sinica TaxID=2665146 RepID=A0ABW1AN21_9RHOO|nr:TonB-dependent receptor [Thauera sp. K11]
MERLLTYFHNRYKNRIGAGRVILATVDGGTGPWGPVTNVIQRWENSGPATIAGWEGNLTVPLARTLEWSSNFTYMSKSEDDRGQPLSLVPDYTLNTWLDWQVSGALNANLGVTRYGEIEARTASLQTGSAAAVTDSRDAYTLVNLGLNYQLNKTFRVNAGVKNLFDKQLQRTGRGANTYNEPGRSFYLGLNVSI